MAFIANKYPVVVLPSGPLGEALFQLASKWTALGLLSDSIWIRPEQVVQLPNSLLKIPAQIMGHTPDGLSLRSVELLPWLGQRTIQHMRLVVARILSDEFQFDETQDALINQLRQAVLEVLPVAVGANDPALKASFMTYNLVVAPAGYRDVKGSKIYRLDFDANIVASPEERSTPWAGGAPLVLNKRFLSFALAHLASAGGLWAGMSKTYVEVMNEQGLVTNPGQVIVSRIMASVVLTDGLAKRLMVEALETISNPENVLYRGETPMGGQRPRAYNAEDDELIANRIADLVAQTLSFDNGILQFTPYAPSQREKLKKMTTGRRIRRLFIFAGDKLKKIPYFAGLWFKFKWDRFVIRKTEGDELATDTESIYDERPDARYRELQTMIAEVQKIKDDFRLQHKLVIEPTKLRTTEKLWAQVRELIFANLDGGNGLSPENNPVIPKVGLLLNDPSATFDLPKMQGLEDLPRTLTWRQLGVAGEARRRIEALIAEESLALDQISRGIARDEAASDEVVKILEEAEADLSILKASGASKPGTLNEASA